MRRSFKVLLTREEEDALREAPLFKREGFEPFLLPLIKTLPLPFELPPGNFDYVLFQSKRAVKLFLEKASFPEGAKPVAVGKKTARLLKEMGFKEVLLPREERAEGLLRLFKELPRGRVLIPRSAVGRELLLRELPPLGFEVVPLEVYTTEPVLYEDFKLPEEGFILFYSPSAVKAFFANLQKHRIPLNELNLLPVAVGKTTEKAVKEAGFKEVYAASEPSTEAVLKLLKDLARKLPY